MVETIRTARLILRDFRPDDAADAYVFFSDPEVTRYLPWEPRDWDASVAETELFARVEPFAYGAWTRFAIELAAERRVAGGVVMRFDNPADRQAEIGWWLSRADQGHGYAAEAVRAVLGWAVEQGAHRIFARADARNAASLRLMERLGMRREAHFRESQFAKGEWIDLIVYAILARDVASSPPDS